MPTAVSNSNLLALVHELTQQNRAALSQLLTIASSGQLATELATALNSAPKSNTPIIAFTGSGGVGKSSLLGAIAAAHAARGQTVGILACDPESPVTGGALLGDRCRIAGATSSPNVFIRSLPTASGQQGVAPNIDVMLDVMKAFRFDRLFLETVGVGQSDIAVGRVADIVVLVLQPQTGDELQWEKAGVLEIANVVVVNKSDLPGSDQTIADIRQQLQTDRGPEIAIVKTSIARNEGIDELCRVLDNAS